MRLIETEITDLSHDGRGVARVEGKATFVRGALPGERVRAQVRRRHRAYDEADVVEVLAASPDRIEPGCAHFGVCGGCVLQHLAPEKQIAAKQRTLLENLARIGGLEPLRLLPALHGEPWRYRRRARMSVKHVDKKDKVLVGFREVDGRYVAELKSCPVLHPAIGERIVELAELIAGLACGRSIPQLEVAIGDALAAVVLRHLEPLTEADRVRVIEFCTRTGLAVFLQSGGPDSVRALWPEDAALSFRLPRYDLEFAFEPLDFVQVNAAMNERMIERALELLQITAGDRVLDLFCGLGNFTLPIARSAASVVGVEGDAGLIARARANAERNGMANAEYFAANLFMDQREAAWARREYDLLLLDPPRVGAAEVLGYLPGKSVRRVVYVSCHPASLARDAGVLASTHGYSLTAAGVMDMFPHTAHVESIALFER